MQGFAPKFFRIVKVFLTVNERFMPHFYPHCGNKKAEKQARFLRGGCFSAIQKMAIYLDYLVFQQVLKFIFFADQLCFSVYNHYFRRL